MNSISRYGKAGFFPVTGIMTRMLRVVFLLERGIPEKQGDFGYRVRGSFSGIGERTIREEKMANTSIGARDHEHAFGQAQKERVQTEEFAVRAEIKVAIGDLRRSQDLPRRGAPARNQ
jgi:hypothetical protein